MQNLRLPFYIITLLILSNICNALEDSETKYKTEKVNILGKSINLIVPYIRGCIDKEKCSYMPNFDIDVHENNSKKSGYILLTNTKSSGFYRIDLSLNQDDKIISKGETETNRSFIDENTINICKRHTFRGKDLKTLDYSIIHPLSNSGFCGYCDRTTNDCDKFNIFNIMSKSFLYKAPNKKTKMYLIKGDKVTLLDERTDDSGQKWYFINYKGKKDLNMWIKAEAVDLEPEAVTNQKQEKEEPKQIEKAVPKEPEPATQIKAEPPKPAKVTKQTPEITPPKNAEVSQIKTAEKAKPIKTATGSISLAFLSTLLGLLALRLS